MRRQISAPRPTTLSLYHFQKEANTWFTGRRDLRVRVDVITCIAVKYNPVNICIVRMSITIGLPLRNHRSWGLVHARLRAINEHRPLKPGTRVDDTKKNIDLCHARTRRVDRNGKRRWFIIAKVILLP